MAKGISLHVDLNEVDPNHYSGWSGQLNACEADAEDLERIASALGYETVALKTKQGTRSAVLGALASARARLQPGDMFLLTYSGHGGQVKDLSGDEDDLADETWCLYDGQLIDDELSYQWTKFAPGVRVFVLSDSCHSGSVTKLAPGEGRANAGPAAPGGAEEGRYRFVPRDVQLRTYRQNEAFYQTLMRSLPEKIPDPTATIRLISGCQDDEASRDGTFNGLFTGTLLRIWDQGRFSGNYKVFHQAILANMPPDQQPNHTVLGPRNPEFDAQRPFTI